jgi:Fur family zinc uptake transcriptional regulator
MVHHRAKTKRSPAASRDEIILATLKRATRPMSAYDVISALRGDGDLAPQTVYRALQRLKTKGLVHRLESLNAFLACTHPAHSDDAAFAICDRCGSVVEFEAPAISTSMKAWSDRSCFKIASTMVEARGLCPDCIALPAGS